MAALLEDTYVSASDVPLGERVALARSGLAERVREADLVGSTGGGAARLRAGAILVLVGWSLFLIAGGSFARFSDSWRAGTPRPDRWVASSGFGTVAITGAIGCGLVAVAAIIALPAFVRFLRAGRWGEVRGPVVRAVVATVVAAALFGGMVGWAHQLSASQRNGGLAAYGVLFVLLGLSAVVAIACGTAAAVSVARRIEVSVRGLRAFGVLALGLASLMAPDPRRDPGVVDLGGRARPQCSLEWPRRRHPVLVVFGATDPARVGALDGPRPGLGRLGQPAGRPSNAQNPLVGGPQPRRGTFGFRPTSDAPMP